MVPGRLVKGLGFRWGGGGAATKPFAEGMSLLVASTLSFLLDFKLFGFYLVKGHFGKVLLEFGDAGLHGSSSSRPGCYEVILVEHPSCA